MSLPSVKDFKVSQKKVLLRTNFDVPLTADGEVADETRIEESLPTIKLLLEKKAKVIIISHLDRPGGKVVPGLSLKSVFERLTIRLGGISVKFAHEILGERSKRLAADLKPKEVLLLENLRFDPGEISNDSGFARSLAGLADQFVNDAFAVSHRDHASIVGLPQFLPTAFGLDFLTEVKVLDQLLKRPLRPVVVVLGGKKKSKVKFARKLIDWADFILVGGKLAAEKDSLEIFDGQKILGCLTRKGEDITMETAKKFKKVIARAKTVVWSGPMGIFEEDKFERGTKEIAQAVVGSKAYTVVGGGDTEAALSKFGLENKVDYISSGGGALLAYLAEGSLPGIEAIMKNA